MSKSFPNYIQIEPTNYCNLSCPRCPTQTSKFPRGIMTENIYTTIIDECVEHHTPVKLFFLGEPLLNPDLNSMLVYAYTKGVPVGLVTNGSLLTNRQIEIILKYTHSISVSIDGTDTKSYEKIRLKGNYKQLRETIKKLYERNKIYKKNITLTTILPNIDYNKYLSDFANEWRSIEGIKIVPLQLQQYNKSWIPPEKNYVCVDGLYSLIIRWNGEITYCCGDVNGETVLGTVPENKIIDVWNGKQLQTIHNDINQKNYRENACKKCKVHYHGFGCNPLQLTKETYDLLSDDALLVNKL